MISKPTLRGYILEEALAYLIRNTGYNLLVDADQDPKELRNERNGLVVIGRGAHHQVDVLGQLSWIPAFSYPLRLFVEAKYWNEKVGLAVVRNAVGVIEDINQNYFSVEQGVISKRYNYNYALFSTSGFTLPAVGMAMAHRISLIDLSGNDFTGLLESIDAAAKSLIEFFFRGARRTKNDLIEDIPEGDEFDNYPRYYPLVSRTALVKEIRTVIRRRLGTWPNDIDVAEKYNEDIINIMLYEFFQSVFNYSELFVGMANGPFLLILKADNPERFLTYARNNPKHRISISWVRGDHSTEWYIRPYQNEAYRLSFILPDILAKWIFSGDNPTVRALDAKKEYLSEITIYHTTQERDELFKLIYNPSERYNAVLR